MVMNFTLSNQVQIPAVGIGTFIQCVVKPLASALNLTHIYTR